MSLFTAPFVYCPMCAHPLQQSVIDHQPRSTCPNCSYIDWGSYSLGVGGVLWQNGKVLLVQRAYNPGKGVWTIPGGYVNQGESIGNAVVREILEETGIQTRPLSIIALRDRPSDNPSLKHDAYIIFEMAILGGSLRAQPEEVSNLGFFSLSECQTLQIASLTASVIKASGAYSQGLVMKTGVDLIGKLSALYQIT